MEKLLNDFNYSLFERKLLLLNFQLHLKPMGCVLHIQQFPPSFYEMISLPLSLYSSKVMPS